MSRRNKFTFTFKWIDSSINNTVVNANGFCRKHYNFQRKQFMHSTQVSIHMKFSAKVMTKQTDSVFCLSIIIPSCSFHIFFGRFAIVMQFCKYNFNLLALLVSIISIHWHKMMFVCNELLCIGHRAHIFPLV